MAALEAEDIGNKDVTRSDAPSNNAGVELKKKETKVVNPAEVGQNVAQRMDEMEMDEMKRKMRTDMAKLTLRDRREVFNDLNKSFFPTQLVMDRIWQVIVWTFAIVFALSTFALCVGALWMTDTAQTQMLLTVVTTMAGILAGFISGRASASQTSS